MNSISVHDLKDQIAKKESLIVIDVRSEEEYNDRHIPFAVNIPLDLLENQFDNLVTYERIITVCGKGGGRSEKAAKLLCSQKLNALFLEGGTIEWFES